MVVLDSDGVAPGVVARSWGVAGGVGRVLIWVNRYLPVTVTMNDTLCEQVISSSHSYMEDLTMVWPFTVEQTKECA